MRSTSWAYIGGAKYVNGPWTVGIALMEYWDQGNVQMTGISQHRARGINPGFSYTVAPGYQVYAEYLWNDQTQDGVNQLTGATGSGANNNIHGQAFVIGNVVNSKGPVTQACCERRGAIPAVRLFRVMMWDH